MTTLCQTTPLPIMSTTTTATMGSRSVSNPSDNITTMCQMVRPSKSPLTTTKHCIVHPSPTTLATASSTSSSTTTNDSLLSSPSTAASSDHEDAPTPQASNAHLAVGTRVIVPSLCVIGTLRFLGGTQFKHGTWAGIELDVEGAGKNNGSVQGVRYFSCSEHTGLFVPASKVAPLPSGMEDDDLDVKIHPTAPSRTKADSHTTTTPIPNATTRSKNCCSSKRSHASPIRHTCATANQMRRTTTTSPSPSPPPSEDRTPISTRRTAALRKTTVPSTTRATAPPRRRGNNDLSHRRTAVPKSSGNTACRIDHPGALCIPKPTRSTSAVRRNSEDNNNNNNNNNNNTRKPPTVLKSTRSSGTRRASDPSAVQKQRQTTVPKTNKLTRRGSNNDDTRRTVVPTTTRSTATAARRTDGGGLIARKTTVPQVLPTTSKSTTTARQKSVPQATSRSTTTRRTKHTVHKRSPDEEQLRRLLEESRKEHAKLCEEMTGKEAAWERTLSTKESYAIQVKEQQREIERLKARVTELGALAQTDHVAKAAEYQATIDAQHQRIDRLDKLVLQLQADASQAKQLHQMEIQTHLAQVAQLRRSLADRDAVTAALEQDYHALEQTRVETIQHYEAKHQATLDEHLRAIEMRDAELAVVRRALEKQPSVVVVEQEDVAGTERRRRLERQLELTTAELDRERSEHKADIQEIETLAHEIQRLHQAHIDSAQRMDQLQHELASEITDKRRIMEEAQQAQVKIMRLQDQHDQLWLAKQKVEHEFAEAVRRASTLEQKLAAIERHHDEGWLLEQINRLHKELEKQERQYRDLETEKTRLQGIVDKRRASSGIQSPISPVSLASFSNMFGGPNAKGPHEDQVYCEICEVFGHDVISCTAYMTTSTPAGLDYDRHSTDSYCVNCDIFGSHATEDCPNQDEMF